MALPVPHTAFIQVEDVSVALQAVAENDGETPCFAAGTTLIRAPM
jgi:hypothetical protein